MSLHGGVTGTAKRAEEAPGGPTAAAAALPPTPPAKISSPHQHQHLLRLTICHLWLSSQQFCDDSENFFTQMSANVLISYSEGKMAAVHPDDSLHYRRARRWLPTTTVLSPLTHLFN